MDIRIVPGVETATMAMRDVVPLTQMLSETSVSARPRFALTFDDDSTTHHDIVLPLLRELQVIATFFVMGRSMQGLGSLWFAKLDDIT